MNNGKLVPSHCVTNVTMFINITEVALHSLWRLKKKKHKDEERGLERSWFGWKLKLYHLNGLNDIYIGKDISRENTIQHIRSEGSDWWHYYFLGKRESFSKTNKNKSTKRCRIIYIILNSNIIKINFIYIYI